MAILYRLEMSVNDYDGALPLLPASIQSSDWYKDNLDLSVTGRQNNLVPGGKKVISRIKFFDSVEDATAWFNTHRLTDATLLENLNTWISTYNISVVETWHELPDADLGITGIFG